MIASPTLYDPVENPRQAKRAARPRARPDARAAEDLAARSTTRASRRRCPRGADIDPPARGLERAVLLDLADPAARGPLPARAWCSAAASRSRRRSTPSSRRRPSRRSPAASAGFGPSASLVAIDNKTGEVKAMVGGTDFDQSAFNLATNGHRQPGLRLQAVHPRPRARGRHQPGDHVRLRAADVRPPERPVRGEQLRRQLLRRRVAADRHGDLGQLRVRPARAAGRDAPDRPHGPPHGHPHAVSTNPAMTLGGLAGGRDPARDGLRLLHDRQQRRAPVRHARARQGRPRGHRVGQGQGARGREQGRPEAGVPGERGAERPAAARRAWSRAEPARRRRSASSPPARPAPPRTTATPGSWASTRTDGGRLGRLPGPPRAHGDRVPRPARGGRHLPRRDLARPHARGDRASATSASWTRARTRTQTTRPPRRPWPPGRPAQRRAPRPRTAPRRTRRPRTAGEQQAPRGDSSARGAGTGGPGARDRPAHAAGHTRARPGGGGGDGGAVAP